MSGLQRVDAGQPNIAPPADDLLSRKSLVFAHPDEVVDDQELKLADKRSLLASWASDALALEDSPSLRQLANGAVVRVDDIMAAHDDVAIQAVVDAYSGALTIVKQAIADGNAHELLDVDDALATAGVRQ